MTFGTPFPYSFFTARVYQMSMIFGTPFFFTGKRVYEMSGCTKWYWTTCQGVPNVRVYQMSVDLLSGYQMSGCTKCQGVPNVRGQKTTWKGCTKCPWHLVHPFSKKPIRKGCTKCPWHLVHPFINKTIRKGCTKCPWHLVHPLILQPRHYKIGCMKCQGVRVVFRQYVRVYQLSGDDMSGCTSCL